jgi:hypothetical protein
MYDEQQAEAEEVVLWTPGADNADIWDDSELIEVPGCPRFLFVSRAKARLWLFSARETAI